MTLLRDLQRLLQPPGVGHVAKRCAQCGGDRDEKAWKEALATAENLLRMLDREL